MGFDGFGVGAVLFQAYLFGVGKVGGKKLAVKSLHRII